MLNRSPSTAAVLGRWQPVHTGHQAVLQTLCECYDLVTIGIGSANVDDYRSPFALAEVEAMLRLALPGRENYRLAPIPDLPDDEDWVRSAVDLFGGSDIFFTANPYVRSLLDGRIRLAHPVDVVPPARRVRVSGTQVRRALARGEGWIPLVPSAVADYLRANELDVRFRARYGLHTLVMETIVIS